MAMSLLQSLFVDDASVMPVYVQLQEQVLAAIVRGELRGGEQLPSVRDVAARLGVNPNTVNRAYMELERAGAAETRRGRGTFVAGRRAPPANTARLDEIAERFVGHARSLGYEGTQIVRAVRTQVEQGRSTPRRGR